MSNTAYTEPDFVQQLRQKLFGKTIPQPIPSTMINKTAQRTLVRGDDGKTHVQFTDTNTGAILNDLTGYEIIEQGESLDWLGEPTGSIPTADAVLSDPVAEEMERLIEDQHRGTENDSYGNGEARTAGNDFGYVDTPSLLGLANRIPGPIGMAAKLGNTAINLNNVQAVNAARKAYNLPGLSKGQFAGGVLGNNQYDDGYIGEVAIGDESYGVSFQGGLTDDGRTTLTANEMRQRNELANQAPRLSTAEEIATNQAKYDADNLDPGIIGRVANKSIDAINDITRDLGSVFGWSGTEIGRVAGEAAKNVTPVKVAEAVRSAKTVAVERSSVAPVGAIGKQRPAVDRAPTPTLSEPAYGTVDARQKANISYASNDTATHRSVRPSLEVADRVREAVASVDPGLSVSVTSGGGEYGSDRHRAVNRMGGMYEAMDFGLVDATGRPLTMEEDRATFLGVAEAMAAKGVLGIGEYGNANMFHADVVAENAWGPTKGKASLPADFEAAIDAGRAKVGDYSYQSSIPTPSLREDRPAPSTMSVEDALAEAAAKRDRQTVASPSVDTINPQTATPAQLSNVGFGPTRTPEQISAVARTLAGELSPTQLAGIAAKDPTALTEAANIVASIENRAQAAKFATEVDPISSVLSPSQYNSNMTKNAAITDENYSKYETYLDDAVTGFYAGSITPSTPEATHYYNADISNPAWGSKLTDPTKLGDHTFGSLPGEYAAADSVQEARDAYGHSLAESKAGVGFAGRANSARSIDPGNNAFEGPDNSSGFAGFAGSPRSMSQDNESAFAGSVGSRGYSPSARSMSQGNDSYDSPSHTSSGFAGSAGSPRSSSQSDSSFDGSSSTGSRSPVSSGDRDYGGSSGSSGSGQQGTSRTGSSASSTSAGSASSNAGRSYSGSSGSSGSGQQGTTSSSNSPSKSSSTSGSGNKAGSGGFAGSSGSARAASQGSSNVSGGDSASSSKSVGSDGDKNDGQGSW